MLEMLVRLCEDGVLVDLRRESLDDAVLRGFIAAATLDFVALAVVDDQCHFDGMTILRTEDVTFLEWGGHCPTRVGAALARVTRLTYCSQAYQLLKLGERDRICWCCGARNNVSS